jgi:hypothetical protein
MSQAAVLAQCITVYLAVVHHRLGSESENHVVDSYESWMEVEPQC